jgi:hypothetical protein
MFFTFGAPAGEMLVKLDWLAMAQVAGPSVPNFLRERERLPKENWGGGLPSCPLVATAGAVGRRGCNERDGERRLPANGR